MLGRPRVDGAQRELDGALTRLGAYFTDAGYTPVAPPHLYLGETLLALYGEDLRARAFLFPDAERDNELCLRPDFTVPVALVHGAGGWEEKGAYTYQGPVFRRQQRGLGRPVEYQQAGVERFGDADAAEADASVLALLLRGLEDMGVGETAITTGDLSIPFALLDALDMPERRRAGLRRHFWRPARFQTLLRRAVAQPAPSERREALLAKIGADERALRLSVLEAAEVLGTRGVDEVLDRLQDLAADAADPSMPDDEAQLIDAMLAVEGPAPDALAQMRGLVRSAGVGIDPALDRFDNRLSALARHGIAPDNLFFDASFGRNLEYYDGFVFEITAKGSGDHPPLSGGGRYDAMTTRLGAGHPVPAVGGMIRPEAVLQVLG